MPSVAPCQLRARYASVNAKLPESRAESLALLMDGISHVVTYSEYGVANGQNFSLTSRQ